VKGDRLECHQDKNKFEVRNPKFETNSNDQNLNDQNKNSNSKQFGAFVLNFEHLNFGFVSDFDIRISDLLLFCCKKNLKKEEIYIKIILYRNI
jgi:hypothetical protein